jgi:hypothetical protein
MKKTAQDGDWLPRRPALSVALDRIQPTLDVLNACDLFAGRVSFVSVRRRGDMIIAATNSGVEIVWPTAKELMNFNTSQAIIAGATNIVIPSPKHGEIKSKWEAAAGLLLKIAAQDGMRIEPALKEEVRDLLRLMWRHTNEQEADNSEDFVRIVRKILKSRRDAESGAPPSVFRAEGKCWVHVPTLRAWLSTPGFLYRHYPLADMRNGLMLLGFEYHENLTRRYGDDKVTACLWSGPMETV